MLLAAIAAARAQTTSTPQELHVRADLNGDARPDLTVISRADGSFRTGYQTEPGLLIWSASRASGAPGAAWAAAGNLTGFPAALAVSAPGANLVSIFPAPAPESAVVPVIVYPTGVGPAGVIAADIGGPGNTANDDLLIYSSMNDAPGTHRRELVRHTGGGSDTFPLISQGNAAAFRAGGRVIARDGGVSYAAVLEGAENSATFRLTDVSGAAVVETANVAGLPGSGFVSERFSAPAYHHFFFWQRGQAGIAWRPAALLGVDGVQFLAGGTINAGRPVGEVILLPGGVAPRLLVVAQNGSSAAVFDFNGTNATPAAEMAAPEGTSFTGAFAREGGGFMLLSGSPGSGLSTSSQSWNPDGTGYAPGAAAPLPGLRPAGTRANVFLFTTEPFVTADAGLVASLNAPEWSSGVQFSGNPASVSATSEIYTGETSGLGSGAAYPFGAAGGAAFALANQVRPDVSLSSFQTVLGPAGLTVAISPPAGEYATAVMPRLTSTPGNAQIFARTGNGPWTSADSFHPRLTTQTTVQFYAQVPGSLRKSPVQTAVYSFSVAEKLMDSDGDGVPDFVENTTLPKPPLDPHSGQDPDSDGYSDLEEFLAGTNPLDDKDPPANSEGVKPPHAATNGAFTVRGAPQPIDGTTGLQTNAAAGVSAEVVTPDGTRLGAGSTALGVPGETAPAFDIRGLSSQAPLAAILTQSVYDTATASPDKSRGRELAALLPVPRPAAVKIAYVPGNGSVAQELTAWLAAAHVAQNASQPVIVPVSLTEHHVLAALLFEAWLNGVALARSLPGVTPDNLTVFPSRPGEASRRALTAGEFEDLRTRLSDLLPAWNVVSTHGTLRAAAVPPGAPAQAQLRAVATDIWRISSLLGVGEDAPDYLPPLDVLREFVRTGLLPAAYLAASSVSPADRLAAYAGIAPLLASLAPRAVATVDLEITPQSFTGTCPLLQRVGQAGLVSLIAAEGVPYAFPESFTLPVGSRVRITGHTDIVDPDCPGDELEVLSLTVTHIPVPVSPDLDGNLLPDAWDCFFFAGGGEPLADSDGDGFSNLQELLDGTDPQLAQSKGVAPVDLGPPQLSLDIDGDLVIEWDYPANYAGKIGFHIQCSDGLAGWVTVEVVPVANTGHFTVTLPLPDDPKKFYRAVMVLAD